MAHVEHETNAVISNPPVSLSYYVPPPHDYTCCRSVRDHLSVRLAEAVSVRQTACQQQADVCAQAADRLAAAGRAQAEVSGWLDELAALLDGGGNTPAADAAQLADRAEQLQVRSLGRRKEENGAAYFEGEGLSRGGVGLSDG